MLTGRFGVGGLLGLVVRQWPFEPLNTILCRIAWSELSDQIAIPHAHVDNTFMRAASRPKQIVYHGQLQQLADVGLILDRRYFSDGRV